MIETIFNDILTDFNCAALVTELTKFILYSKQQIPFSYDKLSCAVKKKSSQNTRRGLLSSSERLFRDAQKCVNSLEQLFSQISDEFSKIGNGTVVEVALILGGSISTAKQAYRIHVPSVEQGHSRRHHSERAIMTEVLHAIVNSDNLHQMLVNPMEPTNMFFLLRKRSHSGSTDSWLLPQPRYNIPAVCQQFHFKFNALRPSDARCCCKGFLVFSDTIDANISLPPSEETPSEIYETNELWYKAPVGFRGFKDIFVKGVSVSKEWLVSDSTVADSPS